MTQQHVMPRWFRWAGVVALVLIVVALVVVPSGGRLYAEPAAAVTMSIEPARRAAPANDTFTVQVVADVGTEMSPSGVGAYEFDLVYDPNFLEVVTGGVTDAGELTGPNARTVGTLGPNIDNATGRTAGGAYSYKESAPLAAGPNGTVVLATVTLRGKQPGMTTLSLENALMTDTQANAWPDSGAGRGLSFASGVLTLDTFGDEIGVRRGSTWYLDYNGNWGWDGGIDVKSSFGFVTDTPLVGDWNGDGGDEIGVRRGSAWYLDYNGNWGWDGAVDVKSSFGLVTDTPLIGDWNGDGKDEIGVRRGSTWYLDYNGNWGWDGGVDVKSSFGLVTDTPLVGDWNSDGKEEIGVRRGSAWYLDYNANWGWDGGIDVKSSFGFVTDTPLIGDWDG